MKTLLIDGDNLLKIGIFGVKDYYYEGRHIGGLYHFLNTIRKHLEKFHYDKVVVFWDGENNIKTRKELYPEYKENRRGRILNEEEQNQTDYQRTRVKQYLEELFVRQGEYKECETDDCIAWYCQCSHREHKTIFSGDKDLTQLIDHNINVYNPKTASFIHLTDKIILDSRAGISIPPQNVSLIKILCGDDSDNISGIKGMGIKTLIKFFPQIKDRQITLEEIRVEVEKVSKENPTIKALENLLTGTNKNETLGEQFFSVNKKIIDLTEPLLTEQAKNDIIEIIHEPLHPEDRGWKNLIKMMMEDGLFNILPKKDDAWTYFFQPLIQLGRKEKKFYNNN